MNALTNQCSTVLDLSQDQLHKLSILFADFWVQLIHMEELEYCRGDIKRQTVNAEGKALLALMAMKESTSEIQISRLINIFEQMIS